MKKSSDFFFFFFGKESKYPIGIVPKVDDFGGSHQKLWLEMSKPASFIYKQTVASLFGCQLLPQHADRGFVLVNTLFKGEEKKISAATKHFQ